MMTERLYYDDAYLTSFDARVGLQPRRRYISRPPRPLGLLSHVRRPALRHGHAGRGEHTGCVCAKRRCLPPHGRALERGKRSPRRDRLAAPLRPHAAALRRTHAAPTPSGGSSAATSSACTWARRCRASMPTCPAAARALRRKNCARSRMPSTKTLQRDVPVRCWFPSRTRRRSKCMPLRKPPTVKEHMRVVAIGDFEIRGLRRHASLLLGAGGRC